MLCCICATYVLHVLIHRLLWQPGLRSRSSHAHGLGSWSKNMIGTHSYAVASPAIRPNPQGSVSVILSVVHHKSLFEMFCFQLGDDVLMNIEANLLIFLKRTRKIKHKRRSWANLRRWALLATPVTQKPIQRTHASECTNAEVEFGLKPLAL